MRPRFDKKPDGLIPAVVQDERTGRVLFIGVVSKKAYKKTIKNGVVTFLNSNKDKPDVNSEDEESTLAVKEVLIDETGEAILIKTSTENSSNVYGITSFGERNIRYGYLPELEQFIKKRIETPVKSSRTTRLLGRGVSQIAKKLGEEAVELVIEAMDNDDNLLKAEASDLLYHFMVLLAAKGVPLDDVIEILKKRRK